jgi:hypothetical protein
VRVPVFARAAVVVIALIAPGIAAAQECSLERAESLARAAAISFNRYYFSVPDDLDRCAFLRTALDRRAELQALTERCGDDADAILVELRKLRELGSNDEACQIR